MPVKCNGKYKTNLRKGNKITPVPETDFFVYQGLSDEDDDTFPGCAKKSQSLSATESTISKNEINEKSNNNLRLNPGPCTHHTKQQDRKSPSADTLSQCVSSPDDFDALAQL